MPKKNLKQDPDADLLVEKITKELERGDEATGTDVINVQPFGFEFTELPDHEHIVIAEPERILGTTVFLRDADGFVINTFLDMYGWFLYNWGYGSWREVLEYLDFGEWTAMAIVHPIGVLKHGEAEAVAFSRDLAWKRSLEDHPSGKSL